MSTEKQIQANQQNAQKSTGPKDTTKTRFNAIKHGLRCNFRMLPGESGDEFHDKLTMMLRDYEAMGPIEFDLVTRIVQAQWVQDRCHNEESWLAEEAETTDENDLRMLRLSQYRIRAERTMFRCMRELRQVQKERGKPKRIPLADEEFLPKYLHATPEALQEFLETPSPQFPEKPSQKQLEHEAVVHQIKMVIMGPNFDASKWPATAVKQADIELGLGQYPTRWPGNDQAQAS